MAEWQGYGQMYNCCSGINNSFGKKCQDACRLKADRKSNLSPQGMGIHVPCICPRKKPTEKSKLVGVTIIMNPHFVPHNLPNLWHLEADLEVLVHLGDAALIGRLELVRLQSQHPQRLLALRRLGGGEVCGVHKKRGHRRGTYRCDMGSTEPVPKKKPAGKRWWDHFFVLFAAWAGKCRWEFEVSG